jgi:transposase
MTFLAARRHDRVEAPWLVDGPINGERFRLYVEQVLAPTLCPTDIVVMDNLGSHNSKAVRRAIRATGAKLFLLPKYSPDLKPIEMLSAKLKHWRRHAQGRSLEAICHALAETLTALIGFRGDGGLRRQFGYDGGCRRSVVTGEHEGLWSS